MTTSLKIFNAIIWILLAAFLVLAMYGLAGGFKPPAPVEVKQPEPVTFVGRGSFYDYDIVDGHGVPCRTHCYTADKMFAAMRDVPRGTQVLVTNTDNGKAVVVTVKDFGPDASVFPDRIIDLTSFAFSKLSPLSVGVIDVKVQVIK